MMSSKARVLIVDDEPIVGERLKASLQMAGFDADAFSSSREAIKKLEQESYDVLVTDLKMKEPDGLEVLRIARRLRPDIKVVVITGFATKKMAEEALAGGAADFVAKPFRISHLKKLLTTLTSQSAEE